MFRKPTGSPADRGAAPLRYRRENGPPGMIIERDVPVPVRGGVTVYADVFRPADERPAPPLIAWSPYGKQAGPQLPDRYPDGWVGPSQLSGYTAFESPDPVYWTARGYAVVNADMPGTWYSGGDATFLSSEEALRGHDLIEWAGTQSWSNGYSEQGLRRQQAFFDTSCWDSTPRSAPGRRCVTRSGTPGWPSASGPRPAGRFSAPRTGRCTWRPPRGR